MACLALKQYDNKTFGRITLIKLYWSAKETRFHNTYNILYTA